MRRGRSRFSFFSFLAALLIFLGVLVISISPWSVLEVPGLTSPPVAHSTSLVGEQSDRYSRNRGVYRECAVATIGRLWAADSKGNVCERSLLDTASDCCSERTSTEDFELQCRPEIACCLEFEWCVAQCMRSGDSNADFRQCQRSCRTSSQSTIHGNRFRNRWKYCWKPWKISENIPADLRIVRGYKLGESCSQSCSSKGMECLEQYLSYVNSCNALQREFLCETRCQSTDDPAHPSWSIPIDWISQEISNFNTSQLDNIKGICNLNISPKTMDCEAVSLRSLRLCACSTVGNL